LVVATAASANNAWVGTATASDAAPTSAAELLTPGQVAAALKVTPARVRQMFAAGEIRAAVTLPVGRLVTRSELERVAAARAVAELRRQEDRRERRERRRRLDLGKSAATRP
jgi:hypothetical protein